jgi:hypothetical protein
MPFWAKIAQNGIRRTWGSNLLSSGPKPHRTTHIFDTFNPNGCSVLSAMINQQIHSILQKSLPPKPNPLTQNSIFPKHETSVA